MAETLDYAQLRYQTLNSNEDEDQVQVNTRALVDKILARYSGEWTTLRELIQNAADASATKVTIKFETQPSPTVPASQSTDEGEQLKHTFLHHTLRNLIVSNNGQAFTEMDWSRLKKIAEGNPDETKIGAFGVGFYSTFAECENPFVISGSEFMAFYWKRDQLFTRRAKIPQASPDTVFVLEYRNSTSSIPSMISICQFLSTSITFVGLESIELWIDDWNMFTLHKKSAPRIPVTVPKDVEVRTKEGMMRLQTVSAQSSQIDATWINIVGWTPLASGKSVSITAESEGRATPSLRGFFSRLANGVSQNNAVTRQAAKEEETTQKAIEEHLMGISGATVFIRVNEVSISTQVSKTFAVELERATKKPPPKQTRISILTSSYDETTASLSTLTGTAAKKAADIITNILPGKGGRIFIGFPTAQTTGLLAHISAPSIIPTVEREQIDLNARYVRTWNMELLCVAGIACRIAYAGEMAVLRQRFSTKNDKLSLSPAELTAMLPAAAHALTEFTFKESTPISKVGQIIEESFWSCSTILDVPSSNGIVSSREVRMASEDLSFVNRIPVVPERLSKEANEFISKLRDFALISEITTSDIKKELGQQALTEAQLSEFLKWAAAKAKAKDIDAAAIQSLIAVTIAMIGGGDSNQDTTRPQLLELSSIRTFLSSSRISPELPIPLTTMPVKFTKSIAQSELQVFGWQELQIVPWLHWTLERAGALSTPEAEDVTKSSQFAAQVLAVISRGWDSMSQSYKTTIAELLTNVALIPTKMGMKRPSESYFASVKLFDDLPTITNLNNVKEKFLKALGIRKTVELAVIFERLMALSSSQSDMANTGWSHVDLIKYLVGVWVDIPAEDVALLQKTPLCPAEAKRDPNTATSQRFKMFELYEPTDALRELGLPVLQWPGNWNPYSAEAKTLKFLGLRPFPFVNELVDVLVKANAGRNKALYESGLRYFVQNHYTHSYVSVDLSQTSKAFLPLQNGEPWQVTKPADCFTDPRAEVLSYPILRQDLHQHATKFGVKNDPPLADCTLRLIGQPPLTRAEAKRLFGYFSTRVSELTGAIADKLNSSNIVPISGHESGADQRRLVTPPSVFLGDSPEYGDIFDYVDFGTEANLFLLKIGCKHEPSITELTQIVVAQPGRILKTLKIDRYKELLYKLHLNTAVLKRNGVLWNDMKTAPFLLAVKEQTVRVVPSGDSNHAEDETRTEHENHLRCAKDILIQDDLICYTLFKRYILIAPQEELLENFYSSLGSPRLSSLVEKEPKLGPKSTDQQTAVMLRELILERARLFLHEQADNKVAKDLKFLEKNLDVQIVQSISLRRTLQGQNVSDVEKRSAALKLDSQNRAVLSVTAKYDVWEVSQCIVGLLFDRPKTQQMMVFETFLVTPLLTLRARGYNVDRILRKKANEEARIAEAQRMRLEAQEKMRDEKARKLDEQLSTTPNTTSEKPRLAKTHDISQVAAEISNVNPTPDTPKRLQLMPGAFHDSSMQPDESRGLQTLPVRPDPPGGLLSQITRSLGLDQFGSNSLHAQNHSITSPDTEAVTSPDRVVNTLRNAVSATRPFGTNTLFSRPQTNLVQEISSYCDTRPGQNLSHIGTVSSGLRVFVSSTSANRTTFFNQNLQGLEYFASILLSCASVFPVATESLHLYSDESGTTIAFNSNGSLFFNYRFFAQLHLSGIKDQGLRDQAIVYWWVVMCHELAHNLVADHSSNHSYWTESFVMQYFPIVRGLQVRLAEVTRQR